MSRPLQEPVGLQVARVAKLLSRAFDDALAEAGGSMPTWLILLSLSVAVSTVAFLLVGRVGEK